MKKIIVYLVKKFICALSLPLILIMLVSCEEKRTPERHLVPVDYEGVVLTIFEQPEFPALPMKDGFRIHEYPADGILITSSEQNYGWASDETLDVWKDGTTSLLGANSDYHEGRRKHYAGSANLNHDGEEICYSYMVIGSLEYGKAVDATYYNRKRKEGVGKLKKLRE